MKSAFGSKRRARKIEVDEDEEGSSANNKSSSSTTTEEAKTSTTSSLNPPKKTFKKSSLRQSIAFDEDGEDTSMPSFNKPSIGRSSSMIKKKNKPASSRLSFGPGEIISGDAAEALEDEGTFTPKKSGLGRRVIENDPVKTHIPYTGREDDEERPTYSKDYLNQLKSSTPTAPKDLQNLNVSMEEEEGLDASELEGAMIVDMDEESPQATSIPTEAEIREKKERRARLAHSEDFISLDSGPDRRQISLLPSKKKAESRLVREDEDIAEGFDEFVDDGRVALGKKQERETKRRQKKEMADMIFAAEGNSENESDDSEAERRAAYEAAQTRAGMDGLHKPNNDDDLRSTSAQVPSKITPLPVLSECLARLQSTLSTMELELAQKKKKLNDSRQEKVEIGTRETEVQELLKQAGARYAALKADSSVVTGEKSSNGMTPVMVDRGLESFGNTPTIRPDVEDVG